MNITIILTCFLIGLAVAEYFDYTWQLDELHAQKRDVIAKLQSDIIQTLLYQRKKNNQ